MVALIGIYSTVSYGVAQRTHEFGVPLFVAVIAAVVPAWRASRIDPMTALRAE